MWASFFIFAPMLTNAEIKEIRSLREKKFRDASGLFVVEGEKLLREAEAADGFKVEKVFRIEDIGEEKMSRISSSTSPPPVLAVVRKPEMATAEDCTPEGLCLALDGIRDPGNMGTIMRTADWFGIRRIYVSDDCVEAFNPKVVQASMGSVFRVQLVTAALPELCARWRNAGMQVYGTLLDGQDIYASELCSEGLIIMGNESNGISREVAAGITHSLCIPKYAGSRAESLNVAVATAVVLAEFRRRT